MTINPRSIRFRLTFWYAIILSAGLCVFSLLIWLMLEQRMQRDIRQELNEVAAQFDDFVHQELVAPDEDLLNEIEEFCHALPPTSYLQFTPLNGGKPFRYSVKRAEPGARYEVVSRTMTVRGEPYRLEIGISQAGMHHTLYLLQALLLGLVPAVILIAGVGGAWLSRRALRPVDQITAAVRSIGIENLANRLPMPGTGDELERLTETWNETLERLESAVAALSRFAADASHELRTPVAMVRTGAEVALRREREPEAYREALREIAAESERMTDLVEDLLFLARKDAGSAAMPLEPLDLRELVNEAAYELRGLAEARGIRIQVDPGAGDATIAGNTAALRRLLIALLDNALKYSPPHSSVRIAVDDSEGKVIVRVEDQGMGIAAEDLPHIFERFYRADKARSNGGNGLGLSLAQSIASAHDTAIRVSSELGRGSVFQIAFKQYC